MLQKSLLISTLKLAYLKFGGLKGNQSRSVNRLVIRKMVILGGGSSCHDFSRVEGLGPWSAFYCLGWCTHDFSQFGFDKMACPWSWPSASMTYFFIDFWRSIIQVCRPNLCFDSTFLQVILLLDGRMLLKKRSLFFFRVH